MMNKKFLTMMFSLLLAVGWTSDASAQSPTKQLAPGAKVHSSASKTGLKGAKVPYKNKAIMDILTEPVVNNTHTSENWLGEDLAPAEEAPGAMLRAPRRADHTASFTAERSWYETFEYQWEDANGDTQTSKITDPATNGHQMASLVKYVYQTPGIPGILYSDAQGADHEYPNIEFGYDIAPRGNSTSYNYIYIDFPTRYVVFDDIQIYVGSTRVSRWYMSGWGAQIPSTWTLYNGSFGSYDDGYCLYQDGNTSGGYFRINPSVLSGYSGEVKVYVHCRKTNANYKRYVQVNHQYQEVPSATDLEWLDWTILPNSTGSIEKPTLNGYTAFIVKVKDQTYCNGNYMDMYTHSWSDITNYFDKYIDAIELLTDGVRIGGTTSNAGTVFSYTGSLNRFYFISKGKQAYLSSLESSSSADRAPFYSMFEEYAPTTQSDTAGVKDFFERMDQGEAYDVVHDCQSVNYMEHYFSMTGKGGTTHNTMSNLLFYIPDDRGQKVSGSEWRDYDHKPRVGLYTAEIAATAKPNKTQEHVYDVYINWSTSLQTILGFDEPETHDLWVVVKDDNGNVVLDSLLTTSPDTTYTYQVPQYPEGYTIDYIIRAWPTTAPFPVDHDANSTGTFFADSDPAQVLIPGYNDFVSLVRRHYESDFDLNTEHNFYRNFMSLSNQNESGLTAADLSDGDKTLKLMRYDLADPSVQTEAANVKFSLDGNTVSWLVNYLDQQIYHGHTPSNKYELLTQGENPVFPTSGSFTVGSSGGGINPVGDITIAFGGGTTTTSGNNGGNFSFSSIQVKSGGSVIPGCSWTYASHGTSVPTGWSFTSNASNTTFNRDGNTSNCYISKGGSLTIPSTMLNGATSVQVVVTGYCDPDYTSNPPTITVNGSDGGYGSITSTTSQDYTWTINGTSGSTVAYDTTYVNVDSISFYYDYSGSTGYFTVNDGNWSSPSYALYMNSSGFAYIRYVSGSAWSNYLQYKVPAGYSNETLAFDVYVGSVAYGSYIGCNINDGNLVDLVQTTSANQYYTLWVEGVNAGDEIRFYGATPGDDGYYNAQSPNIADVMVYRQVVNEVEAQSVLLDMSGITLVDQFSASTANNLHPENYGYQLQAAWDAQKTSNVMEVPVMKTNSTLNGFYTFDQMIHDSVPESKWLPINVRNGDLSVPLRGETEIFFNTIGRKADDDWTRMSYMQFDNNHTFFTEGINYLPQYFGQVAHPGDVIERLDNATVDEGDYNSFNSYVPVVWTYGYRPLNKRHYFDSDSIHNSYGAPIWKTGVGDVNLHSDIEVMRLTTASGGDNPATMWTDENGTPCNLFYLGITADGILPTTNMKGEDGTNYYEPYMFRVWLKSESGSLRGFTPISDSHGDHYEYNATLDHNMQVVYEEYTNNSTLYKPISGSARNIIKFGALKDIKANDLEVIVRFYYKVKHLDAADHSQDNLVAFDFTENEWNIPSGNLNNWQTSSADFTMGEGDNALTINLANKYYYNAAIGFLMLGSNGTLTLPAFDRKVKQIQVVGRPGASNTVKMNVFVGNDAVSTEATGATGTNIFDIDEQYQQIGTQYTIKVTNNYNAQIAQVIVIFEDEQPNGMMMRAPMRAAESHTSSLNFTAACGGSGTADDGAVWTVTSDGTESTFDSDKGIHYGTNKAAVSYVNLTTSDIEGTIKSIVVNASTASGVTAYCDVTVGGNAFGEQKTLTTAATDYTFTGSATGDIVVSIHKPASAMKALYCKSIVVTYETEGGEILTAELTAPESGSTVNVGTNTGSGVSVPVTISGSNITEDLTVSVSGNGFSVTPTTVTANAANAGVSVTVTYNGTDANATGTLTISSNEVNATVNLTASYDGGTTPPAGDAELVTPVDGATVFVGTITAEGESVSVEIPISGNNLTKDLTATLTGTGFSFMNREVTIPYADVNAGTAQVTVVYNGTEPAATGRLSLNSDEVNAVVNLTASYRLPVVLTDTPAGYVAQDAKSPTQIVTNIIETLFNQGPAEVVSVTYVNAQGMQSDKPFDGLNIVVTRFSDGTTTTTKVVR